MKNFSIIVFIFFTLLFDGCKSGLVTMSNSCYNSIQQGEAANRSGNYSNALDIFNQVLQKCDAYDAKEKAYAGKAAALNGMKNYNEALAAANQGLAINKSSIDNLFERASAELGLGKTADAKADFSTITDLTQKNRNVKERATIYEKMAEIDLNQKMYDDAVNNIQQAIALDATNPDFYMLRGDIKTAQENFDAAITDYDVAISKGKDDAEAWKAKAVAYIKSYEKKYGSTDAKQLASRMSAQDKTTLCNQISTAQSKGAKDVNIDLLQLSLCK